MAESFVHLHLHTEFSLLDGAIKIPKLLDACVEQGIKSVAITDNGVMYGVVTFYLEAKQRGINPIIGCELYVVDDLAVKNRDFMRLVLLCKDLDGYRQLSQLVSAAYIDGFYYKPRVDFSMLDQYSKNLIAISVGGRGPVASAIRSNSVNQAADYIKRLKQIYGDDFYLGVQSVGMSLDDIVADEMRTLSDTHKVPLVVTNDVYYLTQDDSICRELLRCIQYGQVLDDDRRAMNQDFQRYFRSPDEMLSIFETFPDAIQNTVRIADQCHLEFEMEQVHLPNFDCPDGQSDQAYLEQLVNKGVSRLYKTVDEGIKDRVVFELDVIGKMQFSRYFLIIYDFLQYCFKENIPVGPGRGSAAGSIVAYALGITRVDPIRYNLLFERFLNPERISMPDIDLDFCIRRRGEVIQYLVDRYGSAHVAQIGTFGTMQSRAVVRDVGRVLDLPLSEVDRIAKLIPAAPGKQVSIQEAIETVPDLKTLYDTQSSCQSLLDYAQKLEGFSRHISTHAAGVVISKEPLSHGVPLLKNDEQITTQYSMNDLERLGLLKIDILGLRNLTVLFDACQLIQARHGVTLDLDNIPFTDDKTFALLASGQTMGIFQLESDGMRQLIQNLKPAVFEDLIALLALYRPGPLGSGMVNDFISNKLGETKVVYELDVLEPILKDTYGMILYQEQVMQIANVVGGFSLAQADMLRRAMGKKKKEVMDRMKQDFIDGAIANSFSKKKASKIFDLCYKFSEYGFNKSHSAAYAVISYQTAYLKTNYQIEYMTALMTSMISNTDKLSGYIQDCYHLEIPILKPDVNHASWMFKCSEAGIRIGMGAIKNVGENAVESIVEAALSESPFLSLRDFCMRVDIRLVNKRVIENLIKAGAFDSLEPDRAKLLSTYDTVLEMAHSTLKERSTGQTALFGNLVELQVESQLHDDSYVPLTSLETLRYEKEVTGLYLSGHPLDQVKDQFEQMARNTKTISSGRDGETVTMMGLLSDCRRMITKRQKEMMAGSLLDYYGAVSLVVFDLDRFDPYVPAFRDDIIVRVEGRLKNDQNRCSIICQTVQIIEDGLEGVRYHLDFNLLEDLSIFEDIRKICLDNRGPMPLYLHVNGQLVLVHRKYWVSEEAKCGFSSLLGTSRFWET